MSGQQGGNQDSRQAERRPLLHLLLDRDNPRFGFSQKKTATQSDLLDHIVEQFGVDDVLSSLAVNGYFSAEPLVCRPTGAEDDLVVIEGNRRLAACLIISGDARAERQKSRTKHFRAIWEKHGKPAIDPVPVMIFAAGEEDGRLLSYLGVRHISSAQPWDSYAKAAWVARVVEGSKLDVNEVAVMIGDDNRTILRLLEGYYFIQQAIQAGEFKPGDSIRRGRGSVTDYPFSWVYTLLGYTTVRRFLGIPEDQPVKRDPVQPAKMSDAGLVVRAMFGDSSKGLNAAVADSRQLGDLAKVVADPSKVALLAEGKSVADIETLTKPLAERIRDGLARVRSIHMDLLLSISEAPPPAHEAQEFVEAAVRNQRSAAELAEKLRKAAGWDSGG